MQPSRQREILLSRNTLHRLLFACLTATFPLVLRSQPSNKIERLIVKPCRRCFELQHRLDASSLRSSAVHAPLGSTFTFRLDSSDVSMHLRPCSNSSVCLFELSVSSSCWPPRFDVFRDLSERLVSTSNPRLFDVLCPDPVPFPLKEGATFRLGTASECSFPPVGLDPHDERPFSCGECSSPASSTHSILDSM